MGKTAGSSKTDAEMLKAVGGVSIKMLTGLINSIIGKCRVSEDWLKIVIVNG